MLEWGGGPDGGGGPGDDEEAADFEPAAVNLGLTGVLSVSFSGPFHMDALLRLLALQ